MKGGKGGSFALVLMVSGVVLLAAGIWIGREAGLVGVIGLTLTAFGIGFGVAGTFLFFGHNPLRDGGEDR